MSCAALSESVSRNWPMIMNWTSCSRITLPRCRRRDDRRLGHRSVGSSTNGKAASSRNLRSGEKN